MQFDDVLNTQREVVYGLRNDAVQSDTPRDIVFEMIEEELELRLSELSAAKESNQTERFLAWLNAYFPLSLKAEDVSNLNLEAQQTFIFERIKEAYEKREEFESSEALVGMERFIIIRSLDRQWQDHLTEMDELRRSVNLRSYGQKDPLNEYKSEAFGFFEELMSNVRVEICNSVFRTATSQEAFKNMLSRLSKTAHVAGPGTDQNVSASAMARAASQVRSDQVSSGGKPVELPKVEPIRREFPKLGRNDIVTIRKGAETRTLKFKKAEALVLNEGWELEQGKQN